MRKSNIIIKKVRNLMILSMAVIVIISVYFNILNSRAKETTDIVANVTDETGEVDSQKVTLVATGNKDGNYEISLPETISNVYVSNYKTLNGDKSANDKIVLSQDEVENKEINLEVNYDKKNVTSTKTNEEMTLYKQNLEYDDKGIYVEGYMPYNSLLTLGRKEDNNKTNEYSVFVFETPIKVSTVEELVENTEVESGNDEIKSFDSDDYDEELTLSLNKKKYSVATTNEVNESKSNITTKLEDNISVIANDEIMLLADNKEEQCSHTLSLSWESSPTCTSPGIRHLICAKCGYSTSETGEPALGHVSKTRDVAASCTTDGYNGQEYCDRCGAILSQGEKKEALGHDYDIVVHDPTCTTDGWEDWTCRRCSDHFTKPGEPALGHIETTVEGEDRTCNDPGCTYHIKCSRCQEILVHPYDIPASHRGATYENGRRCTMCGEEYVFGDRLLANIGSNFLGSSLPKTQIETIKFVETVKELKGTQWDASAGGTKRIIASYEDSDGNGLYEVYIAPKWEEVKGDGTTKIYVVLGNQDSNNLFSDMTNLKSVDLKTFYTDGVYNISEMFKNCSSLTEINLGEHFNTKAVNNMGGLFSGCTSLNRIELGNNFITASVTDMSYMFNECNNLREINLKSSFNTENVTTMTNMFNNCNSLSSLNLENSFNTAKVTSMANMFNECKNLTNLNLGSKFNTAKVTTMANMFNNCNNLTTLSIGDKFDTSKVTTMVNMFNNCMKLTEINLGTLFNTVKVTTMENMFNNCKLITQLNMTGFKTPEVTTMANMFNNCNNLKSLDVSAFDTSKVTTMENMFNECNNLTSLKVGNNFNTENVSAFENMFNNCQNLESLELGMKFYTKNAISMRNMFYGMKKINLLDLGGAFTYISSDNSGMFDGMNSNKFDLKVGEAIYENDNTLKLNADSTDYFQVSANIECKYKIEWTKISSSIDEENKHLNVVLQAKGINTTYGSNNLNLEKIKDYVEIYVDNEKTIDVTTSISNGTVNGGNFQCTLTIDFSNSKSSGNVKIVFLKKSALDIYGNGNLENEILDEETDKNTDGILFADFIKPQIGYTYYLSDIDKDSQTLSIAFNITDKYMSTLETLSKNDLKLKMYNYDANGKGFWENIDISSNIDTLQTNNIENGVEYILTIKSLPADTINKYAGRSGYVTLTVAKDKAKDKSGNLNEQKMITVGINEPDKKGEQQIVDVISPEWKVENVAIHNKNTETGLTESYVLVDVVGTDKFYKSTLLTTDDIIVKVDGEDAERVKKEFVILEGETAESKNSYAIPLYEERDGKQTQYGVKYHIKLTNFEEENIRKGKSYLNWSGDTTVVIGVGTLVDTSNNVNKRTELSIGNVDLTRPDWVVENKEIQTANRCAIIDIVAVDKNIGEGNLTADDITIKVDGVLNTSIKKELLVVGTDGSTAIPLYETRDGKEVQYGKKYRLKLSQFENGDEDYSGEISLEIKEGIIKDKYSNISKKGNLNLGIIDVVPPKINKESSKIENGKVIVQFNIKDKYFADEEIKKDQMRILIDEEDATDDVKAEIISQTNIVENGKLVGREYTVEISSLEQKTVSSSKGIKEWSGTVAIFAKEGLIADSNGNKNEDKKIQGEFIDKITPSISYKTSETHIDKENDEVSLTFEVTDKYYETGSLQLSDLNIVMQTTDKRVYNLSSIDSVTKSLVENDKVSNLNKTKNGNIQYCKNELVGKTYTLTIGNLTQLRINEGENTLNYSGTLSVTIAKDKIQDTSKNKNIAKTIVVGIDVNGDKDQNGNPSIIDTVKPIWSLEETSDIKYVDDKPVITFKLKGTDTYYSKCTLTDGTYTAEQIKDKIKLYSNGQEITGNTEITIRKLNDLSEERTINENSTTVIYGVEYEIIVKDFEFDANQLKIELQEGTLIDNAQNKNQNSSFMVYNRLKTTKNEQGTASSILGIPGITRQQIEKLIFVTSKDEIKGTQIDVSAMEDESITAGYVDSDKNGKYELYIGSDEKIYANIDSSYLFANIGIQQIDGFENLNTLNVKNMANMFYNDSKINSLKFGAKFYTNEVTDMQGMFNGCSSLKTLDFGTLFDTSKVTNMSNMFNNCSSLTKIDFKDLFNTQNATTMENMFNNCTGLTTLNWENTFNTANVTIMKNMFNNCTKLTTLNLGSNFNTVKVTTMESMFNNCNTLVSIDLGTKFNTQNVESMKKMFSNCTALQSLNLGKLFNTSNVTTMESMFENNNNLETLIIGELFNTQNVTTMEKMFSNCIKLGEIDLGEKFATDKVATMSYMFNNCQKLVTIDLGSKFNTIKVTDMSYMFNNCQAIKDIVFGNSFNTSNVTNMRNMFSKCKNITNLELPNTFYVEKVENMTSMFEECSKLEKLDLGIAFTKLAKQNNNFLLNAGNIGGVVYCGERIYANEKNLKVSIDDDTPIEFANGRVECKYRIDISKISSVLDETNKTLTVKVKATGVNTQYKSNSSILDINKLHIYVDGELADDGTNVKKTITETKEVSNGVEYTIVLSNFEQSKKQDSKTYYEWSGNVSIKVDRRVVFDENGHGNLETKIEDEDTNKNQSDKMFIDYIAPEVNYISSVIDYQNHILTISFETMDKYLNSTNLELSDLTFKVRTYQDGVSVWKNIDITSDKNILKSIPNGNGVRYTLTIKDLEREFGEFYKEYSGNMTLTIAAGRITDFSGNANLLKSMTIQVNNEDKDVSNDVIDFIDPIWNYKEFQYDENLGILKFKLLGTDKYFKNSYLTTSSLRVFIGNTEITGISNIELGSRKDLKEKRDGENVAYGVEYDVTISNIKEKLEGLLKVVVNEATLEDLSNNFNKETTLKMTIIDMKKPQLKKISSSVNLEEKTQTIVFQITDNYFKENYLKAEDIKVYVDEEDTQNTIGRKLTTKTLSEVIDEEYRTVGMEYTLVLSNFEQRRNADERDYKNWSGTVKIGIPEEKVVDEANNYNDYGEVEGEFIDVIKPSITYKYTNTDITSSNDSAQIVFAITDKYYDLEELNFNDLSIKMTVDDTRYDILTNENIGITFSSEDILDTINITKDDRVQTNQENQVVGKRYTLKLSNLSKLITNADRTTLDYSGYLTVAIPKDKMVDSSGNKNLAQIITVGTSINGGETSGDAVVVDTVKPVWKILEINSNDGINGSTDVTIQGTDTYYLSNTLTEGMFNASEIVDKIKVYIDNVQTTSGIKVKVGNTKIVEENRIINGVTNSVRYGVQYGITISGYKTNANQVKIEMQEGTLIDTSDNKNSLTQLILFNCLKSTEKDKNSSGVVTNTSKFLGGNITRNQIEKIIFVNSKSLVQGTQWDVSASGDNSIIAGYIDENKNGKYEVYIGSDINICGNVDSSYLFAGMTNLTKIENINNLYTININDMSHMFEGDSILTSLELKNNFNTINVKNMSYMFNRCNKLTTIDLSNFNTSKVTNMKDMFCYVCK